MEDKKDNYYRLAFILVSAIVTSTILLYYSYLLGGLVPSSNLTREYLICFGQIGFQGTLLIFAKQKTEHIVLYLKQMMIVSLIGGFLLVPFLIVAHYAQIHPMICLSYFFAVVVFMFFNHRLRIKNINSLWWLTYTWVLYRFIVLLFIL